MPTYVYVTILPNGDDGEAFEVEQSMTDPPLARHPETDLPVRRVILPPRVLGNYSEQSLKHAVADDEKLGKMGFTKYVRAGDGKYEKRTGRGPDVISGD